MINKYKRLYESRHENCPKMSDRLVRNFANLMKNDSTPTSKRAHHDLSFFAVIDIHFFCLRIYTRELHPLINRHSKICWCIATSNASKLWQVHNAKLLPSKPSGRLFNLWLSLVDNGIHSSRPSLIETTLHKVSMNFTTFIWWANACDYPNILIILFAIQCI